MAQVRTDSSGNQYVNVGNVRFTLVSNRNADVDWSGKPVIRVQAFRSSDNERLHRGAEIVIDGYNTFEDIVDVVTELSKLV